MYEEHQLQSMNGTREIEMYKEVDREETTERSRRLPEHQLESAMAYKKPITTTTLLNSLSMLTKYTNRCTDFLGLLMELEISDIGGGIRRRWWKQKVVKMVWCGFWVAGGGGSIWAIGCGQDSAQSCGYDDLSSTYTSHCLFKRLISPHSATYSNQLRPVSEKKSAYITTPGVIISSGRMKTPRNKQDEVHDLVSRLQTLLPDSHSGCDKRKVPASKILKEACNYITSLQLDVDNLSEKLSQLMDYKENNGTNLIKV
ncbi:hypothetical protein Ccrd_022991 [Cynara cardunculus var. scolymus]|uniref:BHLH domain-containing protein n=1 Tax=Cynara cardunculus var. scolymus TaxID=59895 RepID=A0A103XXK0_CYNCS|nr:hypothetical protein Ccrd_022991 [Cynara cardunculus var. scolymus]